MAQQQLCKGDGSCLEQTGSENAYKKYDGVSCSHNCEAVPCPNYRICNSLNPQWLLWCHKGTCMNCAVCFGGYLQFQENTDCPICLETTTCVKGLKCSHYICVECFKRCHRPPYWDDPQPQFPYDSELEDEYESQWDSPRWRNDPLIQKYEEDSHRWQSEREIREESESYLKACPICRK